MSTTTRRARSERIEIRATPEDRALIDAAVAASDTDLTEFALSNLRIAARRVLADRTEFILTADERDAWDELNRRPARKLPGLRELMDRPSPFTE